MSKDIKNSLVNSRLGGLMNSGKPKQMDIERDTRAPKYPSSYGSGSRDYSRSPSFRGHQEYNDDALEIPHFLDKRHRDGDHRTHARGPLNDDIGHLGQEPMRSPGMRNLASYDPFPTYADVRVRLVRSRVIEGVRRMNDDDIAEVTKALWGAVLEGFDKQRIVLWPDAVKAAREKFEDVIDTVLHNAMHMRVDMSNSKIKFEDDEPEQDELVNGFKVDVFREEGPEHSFRYEVSAAGETVANGGGYPTIGDARAAGEKVANMMGTDAAKTEDEPGDADDIDWANLDKNVYQRDDGKYSWRLLDKKTGEVMADHGEDRPFNTHQEALDAARVYVHEMLGG